MIYHPEYLNAYHNALIAGTACNVGISGDSTSSPYYVTNPAYAPIPLLTSLTKKKRIYGQTFLDQSHPGMGTDIWASTYVDADMASNMQLYIPRWGMNKTQNPEPVSEFSGYLEAGLQKVRAAASIDQCSVLLMTPNMAADHTGGRDSAWIESIIPEIIRLGELYHCTVMDIANIWPDADTGINRWLDSYAVHPKDAHNAWIYSAVADLIWPAAFAADIVTSQASISVHSGFTPGTGGNAPVISRNGDQVVSGGLVTTNISTLAFGTILATTPVGFRPRSVEAGNILFTDNNGRYWTIPVQISANGEIMLLANVANIAAFFLSGLSFIGA